MYTDVVVFDLTSYEWKKAELANEGPPARHSHTSVAVGSNAILVYGGAGYEGPLGDVWILNTVTWEWSRPSVEASPPFPAPILHLLSLSHDSVIQQCLCFSLL